MHPRRPAAPAWRPFVKNHLTELVARALFTGPTIGFTVRFVLLVLAHDRRKVLHVNVTAHPTAQWTGQQLVEAFPWETAPKVPAPRAGCCVGREVSAACRARGYGPSPARASASLAEGIGGAPDREHSASEPGPRHRVERGPPPTSARPRLPLFPSLADASGTRAGLSRGPTSLTARSGGGG